jgi:hypothetical protein
MAFDILHKHLIAVHFSVENQNYVNGFKNNTYER